MSVGERKDMQSSRPMSRNGGSRVRVPSFFSRPDLCALTVLFFVAATPFELSQSGFVYLVKIVAVAAILGYAVLARGARIGPLGVLPSMVILMLLMNGLYAGWERAILAIGAIVVGTLLGKARGLRWDRDFRDIVSAFLVIHVAGLVVAVLVFLFSGNVLELHGLLFFSESRSGVHNIALARLSGFHTEPGTYSQWTLMTLFLLALVTGRLFSRWHAIVATSAALTISLWGVLALGVYLLAFIVEALVTRGLTRRLSFILGTLGFVLLAWPFLANMSGDTLDEAREFLERKSSLETMSGLDKIDASGFLKEEFWNVFLIGEPLKPGFCPQCISPQDAGLAMNATYYFGFVLFAALMILIVVRLIGRWNIGYLLPLALMLVWKAHFYEPLLWIILGFVFRGPAHQRLYSQGSSGLRLGEMTSRNRQRIPCVGGLKPRSESRSNSSD